VEEHVFLKVKEKRSLIRLGCFRKLAAKYCGPFEILKKIGPVAYMIALSTSMRVHNVFHVSLLKKYWYDLNHIIDWIVIKVENEEDFRVELVHSLDWKVKVLHNKSIRLVKFQWTCYVHDEATWENEETMWEECPEIFVNFEENRS
jgi:hypothetical protein